MSQEKKTFPIPANCTKCGHRGEIFVSDESMKKDLDAYAKSRMFALWRPLVVRRMIVSWIAAFVLGAAVGFILVGR